MKSETVIRERLALKEEMLTAAYGAYKALLKGNVQRYILGSRELTRLDLAKLSEEISKLEDEIEELESELAGNGRRAIRAVIPRDW